MFNPFAPLSRPLLEAFVKAGKKYFVRQYYVRGRELMGDSLKGYFIFTHYSDVGEAQHHLKAISHDHTSVLYNWHNPDEREKLLIAAASPEGYKVYSSVFEKDWQKHISPSLKAQVKKYIDYSLSWRPGRGETVDLQIFANYGELYAKLKLRAQEVRIKLEVIEKL